MVAGQTSAMIVDVLPVISPDSVGWITEAQMIEVDRIMIEDLHIELKQMMENAGRNLAHAVLGSCTPTRVAVLAGSGGNGGGGLVAARHLANAGVDVVVTTTRPDDNLSPVAAHQLDILRRMGVEISDVPESYDVAIDALIGYSLRGAPQGRTAELIDQLASYTGTVVALDTPSGLDVTTGETPGVCVIADLTVTLALPKVGLRQRKNVGELLLADISVPRAVTAALGPAAPDFSMGSLLRVAPG